MANTDAQSLVASFLHQKQHWVSSWEVALYLREQGILSTTASGVTKPASADTASRFLTPLVKQGLVEKKRGLGFNRPDGISKGHCSLWRIKI